jgi:hypothetical protein
MRICSFAAIAVAEKNFIQNLHIFVYLEKWKRLQVDYSLLSATKKREKMILQKIKYNNENNLTYELLGCAVVAFAHN